MPSSMRNPSTSRVLRSAWTVCRLTGSLRFPRGSTLADRFFADKMLLGVLSSYGIHVGGLFGLSGATTELSQRKAERQPCAHFVDWMAVRESMT
jgi:hypothetical protein